MTDRQTIVMLEITWDDEKEDHPLAWDWAFLLNAKVTHITVIDPEDQ